MRVLLLTVATVAAIAACTTPDGRPAPIARFFQGVGATGSLSGGLGAMMADEPAVPVQRIVIQQPPPIIQPPPLPTPMPWMQMPPPPSMGMGITCRRLGAALHCDDL